MAWVNGWSLSGRLPRILMGVGAENVVVRKVSKLTDDWRRIPPYRPPPDEANASEISAVDPLPAALGTMELSCQGLPPSVEKNIGANPPPKGSGVKAEPTISKGLAGFAVMLGSLSWLVSRLSVRGIILTTVTVDTAVVTGSGALRVLGLVAVLRAMASSISNLAPHLTVQKNTRQVVSTNGRWRLDIRSSVIDRPTTESLQ